MSLLRSRRFLVGIGVVAVGAVIVWLVWPPPRPEQPRARHYLEFTACLLTDDQGIAGSTGRPVWVAMQDASVATLAKVQYLAVAGPAIANPGNVRTVRVEDVAGVIKDAVAAR